MKAFQIWSLCLPALLFLIPLSDCLSQTTPIVCMPFSGNANDVSGNNHHGVVSGATLTSDRFGNPNSAFDFDGVDDHIQINDSLGSYFTGNDITICFWAKADSIWNNSPFLLVPNSNTERLNIHIYYDNSGIESTFWDYGNISSNGRLYIPNVPFQAAWQHYAFVVSETADSMYVYRDGVLQSAKSGASSIFDRSRNLNIGGGISGTTNCHFNGKIDDVQLFNSALNSSDVYNDYINSSGCLSTVLNYIKGTIYYDMNSNNLHDVGEQAYSNGLMLEINTGRPFYSFTSGEFIFGIDSIGSFEVEPQFSTSYYNILPVSQSATFTTIGEIDSLNDFALQPAGAFDDLMISINPLSPFRPGFSSGYNIHYKNKGTTTLSGIVTLILDTSLIFNSATDTPSIVMMDTILWNVGPLMPFEEGHIIVNTTLQIGTPLGTSISSSVKIDPVITDADPYDNYAAWTLLSTGSYDPNDISVSLNEIDVLQTLNPPYLDYLIRFQNTGTDTAFTVIVENSIPIELDNLTFQLLGTSHDVFLDFNSVSRKYRFIFNNILLPDSNVNEALSHGYILYRITPNAGLTLGTNIINNASIYFDFNDPVLTNNALTSITSTTGLINSVSQFNSILVVPNPSDGNVKIVTLDKAAKISSYVVYDSNGRTILSANNFEYGNDTFIVDLSQFDKGLYFIKCSTNNGTIASKIIKF